MKQLLVLVFFLSFSAQVNAQSYLDWYSYNVDQFYEKIDLDYGTLDEDGDDIDHIYVRANLEQGTYKVEISDETGDLYYLEGTDYYIEFTSYYGYAYRDEGILEINGYGGATFTKMKVTNSLNDYESFSLVIISKNCRDECFKQNGI